MERTFLLKGLDCPHCSVKIEKAVGELEEVESSVLNLMMQTLTVEVSEGCEDIEKKIRDIVHSMEPEVKVSELKQKKPKGEGEDNDGKGTLLRLIIGALIYGTGIIISFVTTIPFPILLSVLLAAYLTLGADVLFKAAKNIIKGRVFDENFLMSLSTVGAFIIGEYREAVAVMLFYQIGEYFQSMAVRRSRRSIAKLMDIRPDCATVKRNGELITLSPEQIAVGEIIVVKAGERIALDGEIVKGCTSLDTRALTGESVPRSAQEGDIALSGCVNLDGVISVKVTKPFGESTASKIIELVENASSKKAPTENFITAFARFYTPAVVILAVLLAFIPPIFVGGLTEWIRRGMIFLVISCPCALVISIPLAFFGGIGAASKHGILIKGGNYLEALNKVGTIVFDKTGTLTEGVFKVSEIFAEDGYSEKDILGYAAEAEGLSNHPIARSVIAAYGLEPCACDVSERTEISGQGVSAKCGEKLILVGNGKLMKSNGISFTPCKKAGTKAYVAIDGSYAGCVLISDKIKGDAKQTIAVLKDMGIEKTVMLTGDDGAIAEEVANDIGIDEYHAELLPQDKLEILECLDASKTKGTKLAFVGDGINDAPALARADVGIAMGGLGSDAAIEAADVVLMTDEPSKLVDALKLAKATKRIVVQNIVFALGIKALFLILGAFGIAGMWEAVFGDVGVALLAVLNSMRILKK